MAGSQDFAETEAGETAMKQLRNATDLSTPRGLEQLEQRRLMSGVTNAGAMSVAYDSSGTLHAAYYDTVEADLKYVTRDSDGTWGSPVTVDVGPAVGAQLSLALDSSGLPGVAYYDGAHGDLKYAHLNAGTWSQTTVDAKGDVGLNPSLAFTSEDKARISYYAASGKDLKLAASDGSDWRIVKVDSAGSTGRYSSIAVNPNDDTWWIAYESATGRNIKLAHEKGKGIVRTVIDHLGKAKDWSSRPSLAFDLDGNPAVSYSDPASGKIVLATMPDPTAGGKHKGWDKSTA